MQNKKKRPARLVTEYRQWLSISWKSSSLSSSDISITGVRISIDDVVDIGYDSAGKKANLLFAK